MPAPGTTPALGAFADPQQPFSPTSHDSRIQPRPRPCGAPSTSRQRLKVPGPAAAATLAPAAYRRRGRPTRGFPSSRRHPSGIPQPATHQPHFLLQISAARFYRSKSPAGFDPSSPSSSQPIFAVLLLAEPLRLARKSPKAFGKFRLQREGRGRSSSSGPDSAVSVRGRCALGTGRRWLAPWLRLLSRRRLLLPVARAAGRSGVLVSDAAEV